MVTIDYDLIKDFLGSDQNTNNTANNSVNTNMTDATKLPIKPRGLRRTLSEYDLVVNQPELGQDDDNQVVDQSKAASDSQQDLDNSDDDRDYDQTATLIDIWQWQQAQDFRLEWWQQHQGWLINLSNCQSVEDRLDLIDIADQMRDWFWRSKIPAWLTYRDFLTARLTDWLDLAEASYDLPFHLLALADLSLALLTVRLARLITTLWWDSINHKIVKRASLIYLPRLVEQAASHEALQCSHTTSREDLAQLDDCLRLARVDPKIVTGLLASYYHHHITSRSQFYDHIYNLTGYPALFGDAIFEAVQMAVYALVLPED